MKIKNEVELLSRFCDKTHIKEELTKPFFNTRYNEVWSTDGHVLIRIKPERLIGEYPKEKLGLPALESPCKRKVTIEAINKALDECPKVDEEIIVQEVVECENCDGSGEVYWEYTDNNGHTHEHLDECPVCDGTGEIEHEETKKTGKKIANEYAVINIGNAYFRAGIISKLKFAMDFLDITSADLISNPDRWSNEFILDDDIHIALMPMLFDPTYECEAKLKLK